MSPSEFFTQVIKLASCQSVAVKKGTCDEYLAISLLEKIAILFIDDTAPDNIEIFFYCPTATSLYIPVLVNSSSCVRRELQSTQMMYVL